MAQDTIDTAQKRQVLLVRIICLFWFFTKIITYKAWIGNRQLPTVSFISALDAVPVWVHTALFIIALTLLAAAILKPIRLLIIFFLAAEVLSVLLDGLRLQPWEYLYLFIFLFNIIYINQPQKFYRALLLLLASTYIFSGLHKFSGAFLHNIWDGFLLYRTFGLTKPHIGSLLHYSGLLLSTGELACGVLLLVLKNKRMPVYTLIIMHLIILFILGIVLSGDNYSVLPWNVVMVVLLAYILRERPVIKDRFSVYIAPPYLLLYLFWFVLPFANLFGYWAHYLSSGMYTGKGPKAYVCVNTAYAREIDPAFISKRRNAFCTGGATVSIARWAEKETGLMPFPEFWYYKRILERLKAANPNSSPTMYCIKYPDRGAKEIK
jgi:hypothetical protein